MSFIHRIERRACCGTMTATNASTHFAGAVVHENAPRLFAIAQRAAELPVLEQAIQNNFSG